LVLRNRRLSPSGAQKKFIHAPYSKNIGDIIRQRQTKTERSKYEKNRGGKEKQGEYLDEGKRGEPGMEEPPRAGAEIKDEGRTAPDR